MLSPSGKQISCICETSANASHDQTKDLLEAFAAAAYNDGHAKVDKLLHSCKTERKVHIGSLQA